MKARLVACLATVSLLLAGCTQTVSGRALSSGPTTGGPTKDFPSSAGPTSGGPTGTGPQPSTSGGAPTSPSPTESPPPAPHLACPHVVDAASRLAYDCVTSGMSREGGSMWPVKFQKEVDVQWTMDEGSGLIPASSGQALAGLANARARAMIAGFYGDPAPTSKKEKDVDLRVGAAKGHLVQTLITLNPGFRSGRHLKVKQERLWIVVVQVSSSQVSGWYISVPDVRRKIWPSVPNLIKTLEVV